MKRALPRLSLCLLLGCVAGGATAQPVAAPGKPVAASVAVAPAPTIASAPTSAPTENTTAQDGRIRAQISAQRQTSLAAEIAAKLTSLPLREGDSFRAGQLLASFECSQYRAQLNKAEATAEAARQTLKVNRRLAELGSISTLEVDQAAAKLKETEAETAGVRVILSKCAIGAPFAGRVAKVYGETHQFVAQGKVLLDIVDTQQLEVRLIVPSKWLAWLDKGTAFSVRVDDLNREFPAKVTRLGARIDPVNQTVSLVGEITGKADKLLPGMSGTASFTPPASK